MIHIKTHDKNAGKLVLVTDMSPTLANSMRRSVLEIPTMAIEDVEIFKNDSALYDEIIAHRLGLVPIKTGKTDKEQTFSIKAIGPKTVYSTDITPSIEVDYALPIVILDKDQEFEVVCKATLGKGIDHVKYAPGIAYYRHNLDHELLDFVYVDAEGNVSYDEEDIQERVSPEQLEKIAKTKKVNELLFTVESWGQLDVKDIFMKAINALDENLSDLNKAVK